MSKKQFRLLKDAPDVDADAIFTFNFSGNWCHYVTVGKSGKDVEYDQSYVENAKDWFEEVLPVSEPVKERIEIGSLDLHDNFLGNKVDTYWYQFYSNKVLDGTKFAEISNLLERYLNGEMNNPAPSALNDTVVEDKGDGIDEITKLKNYIKYLEAEFECNKDKVYTLVEVDAIRADTWKAARQLTMTDFHHTPYAYRAFSDYLSSLNLNSNDTYTSEYPKATNDTELRDSPNISNNQEPTNDNAFVLDDEQVKELARRYYGNLKIGVLLGENATEINEDIERRVFDFYVGYKTANGEKIPNKIFQPINYLQSKQSAPEPSALPTKEWEIVSYKHKISEQVYDEKFNLELVKESFKDAVDIHSVRRLSDNTVFSVGDSYDGGYKITAFKITGTTMMYECNDNECFYNIAGLRIPDSQKPPITDLPKQQVVEDKPPLFNDSLFEIPFNMALDMCIGLINQHISMLAAVGKCNEDFDQTRKNIVDSISKLKK